MDYPVEPSDLDPSMENEYPDIDEAFHYPWQGPQQPVSGEPSSTSVIDPRLYKDLFPSDVPQQQLLSDDFDDSSSIGRLPNEAFDQDDSEISYQESSS